MKLSTIQLRLLMFTFLLIVPFLYLNCEVRSESEQLSIQDEKVEVCKPEQLDSIKDYTVQINKIKEFAHDKGYNEDIGFMIDYAIPSGQFRFFVMDLKEDSIINKGLVCHGDCRGDNDYDVPGIFSNVAGSNCTSLGMAVIAERDHSSWGKLYKYWIDGLEETNSSMRKRTVVLHAWEGVSDEEISPEELLMSWGCPTVSVNFLDTLDSILKQHENVLLYSFSE